MLEKIFKIIFPNECLGCELAGDFICDKCLQCIPIRENVQCLFCGREVILGKVCLECSEDKFLERVLAATPYEDELVSCLIQTCKYKQVKDVSIALAKIIKRYIDQTHLIPALALEKACLTSIPLHFKREEERGFNQSEEVAKHLGGLYNLPTISLLERIHWKGIQKDSTKEERSGNIIGAFKYSGSIIPEVVILIDDVVTTGSTLNEAAAVLKKVGVKRVIALTVAHEGL